MLYEIDEEVKELREKSGLTNRDLANFLRVPPSTLGGKIAGFSRWKQGERPALVEYLLSHIRERELE